MIPICTKKPFLHLYNLFKMFTKLIMTFKVNFKFKYNELDQ